MVLSIPTKDNISITYIEPQYITKNSSQNGKHHLMASASLGYLGYKNAGKLGILPLILEASTVGYGIGIGYDYRITNTISIGAKLGVIGGSIGKYKVIANGSSETVSAEEWQGIDREGLTRVDIMSGIRFYL